MRFFLLLFLSGLSLIVKAQNKDSRRNLSYSQWVKEMQACTSSTYKLTNATINYDPTTDERYISEDSIFLSNLDTLPITCTVFLDDVSFNTNKVIHPSTYLPLEVGLQKMTFQGSFTIVNCSIPYNFHITNCMFSDSLIISKTDIHYSIFANTTFNSGIFIWESKDIRLLSFKQCVVPQLFQFYASECSQFYVQESFLQDFSATWSQMDRLIWANNEQAGTLEIGNSDIELLEIFGNHFSTPSHTDEEEFVHNSIRMTFLTSNRINFNRNIFDSDGVKRTIILNRIKVMDWLEMYKNEFNAYITLRWVNCQGQFSFDENTNMDQGVYIHEMQFNSQSSIDWESLKNKINQSDFLGIRDDNGLVDPTAFTWGILPEELGNKKYTEALIKTKRKFYSIFREQGLTQNSNEVLVEIKNLETAIKKNTFENEQTAKAYFDWKVNQFLFDFSAYGTDIVKAIKYSLQVILYFALFYLFFHNDWDYGSSAVVRKRLDFLLDYFRRKDGLHSLYEEQSKSNFEEIKSFRKKVQSSVGKVPDSISSISGWYYKPIVYWRLTKLKLLRRVDVLEGSWLEKSPLHQKRSTTLVLLWIFVSVFIAIVVKILNAITLSINAFTTLGFGSIPTRGLARYAAIMEGFLGWGLMTIFSATLIKQLLY